MASFKIFSKFAFRATKFLHHWPAGQDICRRAVIGNAILSHPFSRTFSSSNGAEESAAAKVEAKEDEVMSAKKRLKRELEDLPVDYSDISRAKVAIRGGVRRTECYKSYFLSELVGAEVYLKPEFQQFTGSFKERGARNAILQLMREKGKDGLKGVVAASAGNHALALAYHGRELGVPVTVVMPTVAPLAKVDKCRKFDARIIIEGTHIGESKLYAEGLVEEEGLTYVNGYDDPPIVAG
eukprot:CAMPEP_0176003166 /NCGR_PEP_ID=MMETSP0120_2-20121206/1029_1 /TAXON_ID=160619 /ORGANISM="Kryptoperidinium foliaceum, Strain CCMP 1326" /LENGTH=238 /DNA_ID=CAMNT_0017335791 /DNA_START=97 /DNA_END=809 /DNA_ORIENTATION=+